MRKEKFNPHLLRIIKTEISHEIAASRKPVLDELVKYINSKRASESEVHLNFICTHNSRRSQFCQIWAETASAFYNKKVYSYSGGLEITEFNINAVNTIKKCGFDVIKSGSKNPTYDLYYCDNRMKSISVFSKLYNDPVNKANSFAAITTCSSAEENCPFILNAEKRIFLQYNDPKLFDNSIDKIEKYYECSLQIASEIFYVFRNVE
ncbi:MAG: protein-tyrosine-phosphatase [Flavobacteriaceae bacterium]